MSSDTSKGDTKPGVGKFEFQPIMPRPGAAVAPCQDNCPCGTSIRDWIAPVAQRSSLGLSLDDAYTQAWQRIVDNNPFPAIMGRICPHPCETECNRDERDSAVAVSSMERFLGDWALDRGLALPMLEPADEQRSFGVIGAGPAGLSYAYQVARRGHAVAVYDWHPEAGGMLRYGVPDYRLPRAVLNAEIQRIVDMGVQLKTGVRIGVDVSLKTLRSQHHALFFGLGAQRARMLNVPGETGPGVWTGTDFLERFNTDNPVSTGDQLLVIGGGNTAIDVARAARRSGAEVTVVYRRELADMPAIPAEIEQARDEGVRFMELTSPKEILHASTGELQGLATQSMRPGAPDKSGRHQPEPVPGSTTTLSATTVVVAVSQEPDWRGIAEASPDVAPPSPDNTRMAFGGDVMHQGMASAAIAEGKAAALRACGIPPAPGLDEHTGPIVKVERYTPLNRVSEHTATPEMRLSHPKMEVAETITEQEFLAEAERCLSCGSCIGCYQCWMYCNAGSFSPVDQPTPGNYFKFDSDLCEGCGKCIELCPCGFLSPLE